MRVLVAVSAGAFLALVIPLGSASADAAVVPFPVVVQPAGSGLIQADWNGRPDWHHHWQHEWRDHWRPEWHPYWHHHWHHDWNRGYGRPY